MIHEGFTVKLAAFTIAGMTYEGFGKAFRFIMAGMTILFILKGSLVRRGISPAGPPILSSDIHDHGL